MAVDSTEASGGLIKSKQADSSARARGLQTEVVSVPAFSCILAYRLTFAQKCQIEDARPQGAVPRTQPEGRRGERRSCRPPCRACHQVAMLGWCRCEFGCSSTVSGLPACIETGDLIGRPCA